MSNVEDSLPLNYFPWEMLYYGASAVLVGIALIYWVIRLIEKQLRSNEQLRSWETGIFHAEKPYATLVIVAALMAILISVLVIISESS